jgi:hypothetical protein
LALLVAAAAVSAAVGLSVDGGRPVGDAGAV